MLNKVKNGFFSELEIFLILFGGFVQLGQSQETNLTSSDLNLDVRSQKGTFKFFTSKTSKMSKTSRTSKTSRASQKGTFTFFTSTRHIRRIRQVRQVR